MRFLISTVAPAFLAAAGQLVAQQPDQQTIPRELAVAFARAAAVPDSTVAIEFFPGTIAPAVADRVSVPPGARLIGTVAIARNTFVLAASIDAPDSILAWYARDYAKRGWSGFSLVRVLQTQSTRGGFRPPPPARPSSFCSGGTVADISASRGLDGQTNIRVRVGPPPVVAVCPQGLVDVRPGTPVNDPGSGDNDKPLRSSTLLSEGLIFAGGTSLNWFDTTTCVVRLTSLFRLVSVRTGALEFCKATVVASDLTTGASRSNPRPTVASTPSRRRLPVRGLDRLREREHIVSSIAKFVNRENFPNAVTDHRASHHKIDSCVVHARVRRRFHE
jgi:hypothetical protein